VEEESVWSVDIDQYHCGNDWQWWIDHDGVPIGSRQFILCHVNIHRPRQGLAPIISIALDELPKYRHSDLKVAILLT